MSSPTPPSKAGCFWADNRVLAEHGHAIKSAGIAVYAALAMHAGRTKPRTCFPSIRRLMVVTRLSKSTVIRALGRLVADGLIQVVKGQTVNGRVLKGNFYVLVDLDQPQQRDLFTPLSTPLVDAPPDPDPGCAEVSNLTPVKVSGLTPSAPPLKVSGLTPDRSNSDTCEGVILTPITYIREHNQEGGGSTPPGTPPQMPPPSPAAPSEEILTGLKLHQPEEHPADPFTPTQLAALWDETCLIPRTSVLYDKPAWIESEIRALLRHGISTLDLRREIMAADRPTSEKWSDFRKRMQGRHAEAALARSRQLTAEQREIEAFAAQVEKNKVAPAGTFRRLLLEGLTQGTVSVDMLPRACQKALRSGTLPTDSVSAGQNLSGGPSR